MITTHLGQYNIVHVYCPNCGTELQIIHTVEYAGIEYIKLFCNYCDKDIYTLKVGTWKTYEQSTTNKRN